MGRRSTINRKLMRDLLIAVALVAAVLFFTTLPQTEQVSSTAPNHPSSNLAIA